MYYLHNLVMSWLIEYSAYWLEALHGFASKLCGDGVRGEGLVEVNEGSSWWYITPVEEVVQLQSHDNIV